MRLYSKSFQVNEIECILTVITTSGYFLKFRIKNVKLFYYKFISYKNILIHLMN
jgi:hypothetical protein